MNRAILPLAAAGLTLGAAMSPAPSMAKGCLKGAAAGGVAGHYAGHHAVLGALGGCLVGRHLAHEKTKQNAAAAHREQEPTPAAPENKGY